jgi:aminoglycoside 6'-N-acetyltransferase
VPVSLRLASLDDVPLLERWDTLPHVIAATGDDDVVDWVAELTRRAPWSEQFMIEADDRPVGIIQVIDPREEETHYWGDAAPHLRAIDIWIGEPEDLGRGFGTEGMRLAIDHCFADPDVSAILIDPLERNHRARAFYRRLGFVEVGPRRFGTDDCMVMRLDRSTPDDLA